MCTLNMIILLKLPSMTLICHHHGASIQSTYHLISIFVIIWLYGWEWLIMKLFCFCSQCLGTLWVFGLNLFRPREWVNLLFRILCLDLNVYLFILCLFFFLFKSMQGLNVLCYRISNILIQFNLWLYFYFISLAANFCKAYLHGNFLPLGNLAPKIKAKEVIEPMVISLSTTILSSSKLFHRLQA